MLRQAKESCNHEPARALAEYARREPERTLLSPTLRAHWLQSLAEIEAEGRELPAFVKDELEAYLHCGIPVHGFHARPMQGLRIRSRRRLCVQAARILSNLSGSSNLRYRTI
jgi:hypothetical protein